ncbi:MAG: rod-binding protein [Candidatus Scalindua sediminis]|nr:rod-binding protein [Candidatus Scalindua sediminis]
MDIPFDSEFVINSAKIENSKNILKNENNNKSPYELKKATQNFEAIFINMLIKSMWKTIPESGLFEENSATNIYEGIIQSALSEEIARSGGLGMAEMLYQQISKEQK